MKLVFDGDFLPFIQPPNMGYHSMSAVRDCLFSILATTFHIWRSSPSFATEGRAMPWWQGPT